MKKSFLSLVFIFSLIAFFSFEGQSQSLDVVNNSASNMNVTYCGQRVCVNAGGGTASVMNPCPTSPPCDLTFQFGCPTGAGTPPCSVTIPLSPCPVAGVSYSYGVSGYPTGCAVPNISFSITIDPIGNVVIRFVAY